MLWVLCFVFVVLSYLFITSLFKYWLKNQVEQKNPNTLVVDFFKSLLQTEFQGNTLVKLYNSFPNSRYVGIYQFLQPWLMLKSPELIKQITVKDFEYFTDHRIFTPLGVDPFWDENLLVLKGKKWKDMRVSLSPAFTSSKMKMMFCLMSQNGEQFVRHFLEKKENFIEVEMKDIFSRFTNDAIANTAFGVECDSLKNPKNNIYLMGKEATDISGFQRFIKIVIGFIAPQILKIVNASIFSKEVKSFFYNLVDDTKMIRGKNKISRPDLMDLLLKAQKKELVEEEASSVQDAGFATVQETIKPSKALLDLTNKQIASQVFIFFFAGFDTVSTLMTFMSHELAVNPDIQDRLIQEIDETRKKNPELTYEALIHMKYLDMVVSETLRKWPPFVTNDRVCTKAYTIEPELPNEKPLRLEKNSMIMLPIMALHRDPNHFPNPEKFDPERFNDENKHKINPYVYIPFGSGARNCIGSRFALLETKTLFFYILSHFKIVPNEKTEIPIKVDPKQLTLNALGGVWLGFQKR